MRTMEIQIPESMRIEHDEIHGELVEATKRDGRIGEAARDLAKVLHSHFEREEEIALPPLGLLRPLAAGEFDRGMMEVLGMTDALREELPQMLEEHRAIAAAARRLGKVAHEEGDARVEKLAQKLQLHAQSEEELFYPAALLVGELVRARAT
ncbi:MAG TPA: hemerythrin domain-containing protein [Longimicrobiales bacterium]|nr:hemerythrin domain-containing protein [Longimicrobiales bacterium]